MMSNLNDERMGFINQHLDMYRQSGGAKGHYVNLADIGAPGPGFMPTLLLRTTGRKTGRTSIVPLLYGLYRGEFVVIGSKGASVENPGWYLNLQSDQEVSIQVGPQFFRGPWREAFDEEHHRVWRFMLDIYPPYAKYQEQVERVIPVVMIRPDREMDSLEAE